MKFELILTKFQSHFNLLTFLLFPCSTDGRGVWLSPSVVDSGSIRLTSLDLVVTTAYVLGPNWQPDLVNLSYAISVGGSFPLMPANFPHLESLNSPSAMPAGPFAANNSALRSLVLPTLPSELATSGLLSNLTSLTIVSDLNCVLGTATVHLPWQLKELSFNNNNCNTALIARNPLDPNLQLESVKASFGLLGPASSLKIASPLPRLESLSIQLQTQFVPQSLPHVFSLIFENASSTGSAEEMVPSLRSLHVISAGVLSGLFAPVLDLPSLIDLVELEKLRLDLVPAEALQLVADRSFQNLNAILNSFFDEKIPRSLKELELGSYDWMSNTTPESSTQTTAFGSLNFGQIFASLERFTWTSEWPENGTILLKNLPPTLKHLYLVGNITDQGNWLRNLETEANRLETLSIQLLAGITQQTPFSAFSRALKGRFASSLRSLAINGALLSGTMEGDFVVSFPNLMHLDLINNLLEGAVPWIGVDQLVDLSLGFNRFTSWPNFLPLLQGSPSRLQKVNLSINKLESIPDDSSWQLMAPSLVIVSFIGNPNLSGRIPSFVLNSPVISQFYINGCNFSGPIDPTSSRPIFRTPNLQALSLSTNQLCGPLPSLDLRNHISGESYGRRLAVDLAYNQFSGAFPSQWQTDVVFDGLFLQNNSLSQTFSGLDRAPIIGHPLVSTSLNIGYNQFNGTIFNLTKDIYRRLEVKDSGLDLCPVSMPNNFPGSNILQNCYLDDTYCACDVIWHNGCGVVNGGEIICPHAGNKRDSFTTSSASSSLQLSSPSSSCIAPPPRIAAPAPPLESDSNCPLPKPALPSILCINGTWTAPGSVSIPTVVIPPNTVVIIRGNVSIGGVITLSGLNSSLIVGGCVTLGGTTGGILVELTPEDIKLLQKQGGKLQKTLISSLNGQTCLSDLSSVSVKTKLTKKDCKRVNAENNSDKKNGSLTALFQIDSTKCNLWWIILASVLGGIIVLAAVCVVVVLVIRHNKEQKARKALREG